MFIGMMSSESELLPLQSFMLDVQPWTSWLQPGDRIMVKNKIPRFVIGAVVIASIPRYTSFSDWPESFSSVQSLSHVRLFANPWIAARKASLSIINSWSLLKLMSIKSVMPTSHLILCRPLLLLPWIPPSIRVFSNESTLHMRWPKYWSFSLSISPSNEHPGLISLEWTDWISLQFKGILRVFSNTTVQKHQFFSTQLSSQSNSHIHAWPPEKP